MIACKAPIESSAMTLAVQQSDSKTQPSEFERRLLTEAVRLYEDAQGALDEPEADAAAQAASGDFEHRLMVRSQKLSVTPALTTALHQLRSASSVVIVIGLIMAVIAGASAAQLSLGLEVNQPVNFFWALSGILGVHTILLLLWAIMMIAKPQVAAAGSLGGLALTIGRRLTQWLHRGPIHLAVIRANASVYGSGLLGRWTLSAVSHAFWLSYLTGCVLAVVLILSIKQYTFAWETTILSEQTYITLTRTIASGPKALGFTTPDAQHIAASRKDRRGMADDRSREAWSGLLIGSIVAYGLLPRAVLLALSVLIWRRAGQRFRLDTHRRGYARLQTRLLPVARTLGVIDQDNAPPEPEALALPLTIGASGPTAIMGFEVDPPATAWPPALNGIDWLDLGFVEDRASRQQAMAAITSTPKPPRLIVVVCSLAVTPDRGTRTFIHELQQSIRIPIAIVLTEGQRLRNRSDVEQVRQRIEDWRTLAIGAQVMEERVIEVDLEHLTAASRANLSALLNGVPAANNPPPPRQLESAFGLIVEHVQSWPSSPDIHQQAELHRAIARLHQGNGDTWQTLLRAKAQQGRQQAEQFKTSAERVVNLLPTRLHANPRWLAAGAVAGALSCVTAATLLAPAAIAALPAWAGLGAAVSLLAQPEHEESAATAPTDFGTAVRSAALFALLLELQGRDEIAITRIIDHVAGPEDPKLEQVEAVHHWLDDLRHRFDQALAVEGAS